MSKSNKGRLFIQLKAESVADTLVAVAPIEDAEAVEVNIAVFEVDVVIVKEVLCECVMVEADVKLSLLSCDSFALLEIDDEVEVIVEDRATELSRSWT